MNDKDKTKATTSGDWVIIVPTLVIAFIITFLSTLYPQESWDNVRTFIAWISFSWLVLVAVVAFVRKGRP